MQPRKMFGPGLLLGALGAMLATGCDSQSVSSPAADSESTPTPGIAFAKKGTSKVLESPARIAHGENGTAWVTDARTARVVHLDLRGPQPRVTGSIDLKKAEPLAVAYAAGRLFVGNVTDGRVDIYDVARKKPRVTGSLGEAVAYPADIAIDPAQDLVFVLDGGDRVIKVFSLGTGVPLYHISGPGLAEFDLQNATGITIDPVTREVLVSDYGEPDPAAPVAPRIKIFTYAGAAVVSFSGKTGMLGQRFSRPQGLALNASGHILVVEAMAGEIVVLDRSTGATLATLGSFGTLPGELWLPLDVIVDDAATAYVTNNRSGRIEVFDLGGLP